MAKGSRSSWFRWTVLNFWSSALMRLSKRSCFRDLMQKKVIKKQLWKHDEQLK